MNNFFVGQQVICVDDQVPIEGGKIVKDAAITEGQIYTVRWIGMASHYVFGDYLGVKLEGVDSKFGEAWGQKDAPFAARRFRPLVNDPIALFRQIAADPNHKIDAPEGPVRKAPVREPEKEDV